MKASKAALSKAPQRSDIEITPTKKIGRAVIVSRIFIVIVLSVLLNTPKAATYLFGLPSGMGLLLYLVDTKCLLTALCICLTLGGNRS